VTHLTKIISNSINKNRYNLKTTTWLEKLLDEYYAFLKGRTSIIEETGTDWHVISTPFVGLFNDTIELYIKKQDNNKILLSDDSITINNLELMGASISRSPKRKEIMDKILLNYGLQLKGNEIVAESTEQSFVQKKFGFISAISEINDMYMLAKHSISSIFMEDVQKYLNEQNNFNLQQIKHDKELPSQVQIVKDFAYKLANSQQDIPQEFEKTFRKHINDLFAEF
jgi:hypothetical protein